MHIIAIYNNKGGVGKSTITVLMADFLATITVDGRPLRVLVLDLDGQGSSATALLGRAEVARACGDERSIGHLAQELGANPQPDIAPYLILRPTSQPRGRARPLPPLWVMVPEKQAIFDFESNPLSRSTLLKNTLKPLLQRRFDIVLVDMPGNIDERNLLVVNALVMSDSVVVPVESSRISLNAMPDTLRMIQLARAKGGDGAPAFLGMILDRADRRTRSFRLHGEKAREMAGHAGSPWFDSFLPNTPDLAMATDDSQAFESLRARYGNHHGAVQKVVLELFHRWRRISGSDR